MGLSIPRVVVEGAFFKMKCKGDLKEFKITGRRIPTEKDANPPLFRMRIFAPGVVAAKSRFWYYMRKLKKLKKSVGEIVQCSEIYDDSPTTVKVEPTTCTENTVT